VADRLNLYNQYMKDPNYVNQDLARYAAVTTDGVKKFAAEQLAKDHRVVVYGLPGKKIVPPGTAHAARAHGQGSGGGVQGAMAEHGARRRRHAGRESSRSPSASASRTVSRFSWSSRTASPIVANTLVLRSGSAQDPENLPGLAGYTSSMLDEGTQKRDALAIANELHGLGATLNTGASVDGSTIGLPLAQDELSGHHGDPLRRGAPSVLPGQGCRGAAATKRATALMQQRDSPNPDREPPHVELSLRTQPSLRPHHAGHRGCHQEDLARRHDEVLSGVLHAEERRAGDRGRRHRSPSEEAGQRRAGLLDGPPTETPRPPQGQMISSRVVIVDKPGMPQTALRVVQLASKRSDPRFRAAGSGEHDPGRRLLEPDHMNLREAHGYTYGAFSSLSENRGQGPFLIGTSVRTDVTGPSIDEILKEVHSMSDKPVTDEELRSAKSSPSAPFRRTSRPRSIRRVRSRRSTSTDLPPDYYVTLPSGSPQITAAGHPGGLQEVPGAGAHAGHRGRRPVQIEPQI